MRIAGDGRVEQVGLRRPAVLDGTVGRAASWRNAHPADSPGSAPFSRLQPLSGEAEDSRGVMHSRVVARSTDGVQDSGLSVPVGCELGRHGHGLVRREHEVEAAACPLMVAPGLAGVGPPRFEQGVELAVAGSGARACDAERRGDAWVHVGPPVRPFASACVVGREALAGFEVATVEGDAMHLEKNRTFGARPGSCRRGSPRRRSRRRFS